ncbi:MAG: hypothetical protein ACOCX1_02390 [Fimbriimonadaceae bacterium]
MDMLLYVLAALILALVLLDSFMTVVSTRDAGPLTKAWTHPIWGLLLRLHRKRSIHGVLSYTGPVVLVATILVWYFGLWLGFFLIFLAGDGSVVESMTKQPATALQKAYYTSSTISTLGLGDYLPNGFPWTMFSTLASLVATIVLTLALSYVLSVVSAVLQRRQLAHSIYGLGSTVPEVLDETRLGKPDSQLQSHLLTLASQIDLQGIKHIAYPILEFFHAPEPKASPSRAVLLLSDAMFLLRQKPDDQRPPDGVLRLVESSLENYAERSNAEIVSAEEEAALPDRVREAASEVPGVDPDSQEFKKALDDYLERRGVLVAMCNEDGWRMR